jgi:Predicted membrane protein (DUF2142)
VAAVRRAAGIVFAGDRRVWRVAALAAAPLLALTCAYCLWPRDYFTGTDSVEALGYVAQTPAHASVCVPGLQIPAGTARIRLKLLSRTATRPAVALTLQGGVSARSDLPAAPAGANRMSTVDFPIARLPSRPAASAPVRACLTADDLVNWGGTPLPTPPSTAPPTLAGGPLSARIAVWYLPAAGAQRSYLSRIGEILARASLFRPAALGPWSYALVLFVVLPLLALAAVRCLAVASAPRAAGSGASRLALALFAIGALNFICWALITPPFQAPDEVDHFAYTQSLAERGRAPTSNPASPRLRWSTAEDFALERMSFFTDHQMGDTRPPWLRSQERAYRSLAARLRPPADNGGGNETAASHGPVYYAALVPAYALASSSPLDQLTLMRLTSALIGALTVLFTYLLTRELAPGRQWLGVLAALLVAYQPMYGFISGAVNNDVGVNAGAAALELLLFRVMRRGLTLPWGALIGALLIVLPLVKATVYSLYPVAALALLVALWRHHRRSDLAGWAALVLSGALVGELWARLGGNLRGPGAAAQAATAGSGATVSGATSEALAHPLGYLAYLWEVFLPRLSFMAPHFPSGTLPGFVIFVERGWGAFGWYDVFFSHWVYRLIFLVMLAVLPLAVVAARREWAFVRAHALEAGIVILMPLAVVAGAEAAFYTTGTRPVIAEFGRYAFPAIAPLALLVVASLHAFGRRWVLPAATVLLVAMLALGYAAQLVTLTGFYA